MSSLVKRLGLLKYLLVKHKDFGQWCIVATIAIIVAVLNILHVIIGYAKTPAEMVYLWTGHYYLDYFEYVEAIAQGKYGKWLIQNNFATDDPSKTFLARWQYLILGKIGNILKLHPISTYWFFVFVFTVILALLIFITIKKILHKETFLKQFIAYLLTLFAAPFFTVGKLTLPPDIRIYAFWADKGVLWKRFEVIPYHLTALILSITVLLWLGDLLENIQKLPSQSIFLRASVIGFIIFLLLTFSPASALLVTVAIFITNGIYCTRSLFKKQSKIFFRILSLSMIIFLIVLPSAIFVKNYLVASGFGTVSKFESLWQVRPGLGQIILTHGPLILIAVLGIVNFIKKSTPIRLLLLFLVFSSYAIFFSSTAQYLGTTNARFMTPLSYILFGVLAVLAFKSTSKLILIAIIILTLSIPSNIVAFKGMLDDKNIFSPITYLPKGIIDGFNFIDAVKYPGSVMLTPSQFLGSVLPIFADRHVYVARHNTTPNYIEKNITASNFYLGAFTNKQALDLLNKNNIKIVVWTSIEGYDVSPLYHYPFLREIYKNKDTVIFKVINK